MAIIKEVGALKMLHCEFNSLDEVFRVIDRMGWQPQNAQESNAQSYNDSFNSFNSLEEAKDVYRNHPDKIRDFKLQDLILEARDTPGKDVEFDITGDYVDIDRYLEGIPEVFGNATLGNPNNIFCTINILIDFVWHTKPSYIIARQKRILRLVDWLENQGVRCQLVAVSSSECLYTSIVIKQFQDPVSINDLAVINHPDFLRRIIFLLSEQSKTWSYGYGNAIDYDRKMARYESKPEDGLYIYVGGYIPPSENKMHEKFDYIETYVQNMLDLGMTYNDEKLNLTEDG